MSEEILKGIRAENHNPHEWRFTNWPGKGSGPYENKFHWHFDGELKLSLTLNSDPEGPIFELARFIEDPKLAYALSDSVSSVEDAGRSIRMFGSHVDIFWEGGSLEELEAYLKESLLPLPKDTNTAWKFASDPWNDDFRIKYLQKHD